MSEVTITKLSEYELLEVFKWLDMGSQKNSASTCKE